MTRRLGVIAEDMTDAETIQVLARRLVSPELPVELRASKTCTKLATKARVYAAELELKGCDRVVLIHDLDRTETGRLNDEAALRRRLEGWQGRRPSLLCVPIEELEAWFWADPGVLAVVAGATTAAHAQPHLVVRPKEALQRLSRRGGKRPRYSTADNKALAGILDLDLCAARCPAFRDLRAFLERP